MDAGRKYASPNWWWFVAWMAAGACLAFVISALAVFLVPVGFVITWMLSRRTASMDALGVLAGAGLPLLWIAWLQREGPGTTCWHTQNGTGCDQHLNPVPWLLLGIALVLTGVIARARAGRQAQAPRAAAHNGL